MINQVKSNGYHLGYDPIAEFRNHHLRTPGALFVDVLRLCQKTGLVNLGPGSLKW
jgi:hypothetical protein